MIELTASDVAVILRLASNKPLDYLPQAELNDDGQTEIVRWIETVGKADDSLTPYAWYSLAEQNATAGDPDEPVTVEMLPLYTLSGESETLELCRESHFDWSIEAIPVEIIQNAEDLNDAGIPVHVLVLAEAAGEALFKQISDDDPDVAESEPQLLGRAINAFFVLLCDHADIELDEWLRVETDEDQVGCHIGQELSDEALQDAIGAARDTLLWLAPELGESLTIPEDLLFD
ncbi:MAG: hypothetical protein H6R04_1892 [Burkholderiaceae bacterium]|nr:hypothetical protein [Burkholderiaceae bacterium]